MEKPSSVCWDEFPKETGKYIICVNGDVLVEEITSYAGSYAIIGTKYYIDMKDWKMYKIFSSVDQKKKKFYGDVVEIKNIKSFYDRNVLVDMSFREEMVGKIMKIFSGDDHREYKILNIFQHIHCWSIFNIEDVKTREPFQILVTERNKIHTFIGDDWVENDPENIVLYNT